MYSILYQFNALKIMILFKQLQSVLTDYLDIQNTTSVEVSTTASEFVEQSTNINKFFGRSKQQT